MKTTFKGFLYSVLLAALFVTSAQANLVGEIAKRGIHAIDDVLVGHGISGQAGRQVRNSVETALTALNGGVFPKTEKEIISILDSSENFKALKDIMLKEGGISKRELSVLINRTATEAELSGKAGAYMMCGMCVDEVLAEMGVKVISQRVNGQSTIDVLKSIPTKPDQLNREINTVAKAFKVNNSELGTLLSRTQDVEKRKLLAAFRLMKGGSGPQKEFGQALKDFNTVGTNTFFAENKLWTLVVDSSESDLAAWTKRLKQISKEDPIDASNGRISNLERSFTEQAEEARKAGDDSLSDSLKKLKEKNCWGIF